jgi:hypothetical protein
MHILIWNPLLNLFKSQLNPLVRFLIIILFVTGVSSIFIFSVSLEQYARAIESSQPMAEKQISNFSNYTNSSFGMSISYPANWKKVEDYSGSWFRNSNESVNVRLERLPGQNLTINEVTNSQLNLTRNQFPGQKILESNTTTIGNNYPAHKIVFTFPEEPADPKGLILKELKAWTIGQNSAYVISYFTTNSSYSYYLPQITKMIGSFRFNN